MWGDGGKTDGNPDRNGERHSGAKAAVPVFRKGDMRRNAAKITEKTNHPDKSSREKGEKAMAARVFACALQTYMQEEMRAKTAGLHANFIQKMKNFY